MKLNKTETQRLALGGLLGVGLLYVYFYMLLGPLAATEKRVHAAMAETAPKIAEAKAQVDKTQSIEAKAPAAQKTLNRIKALIPDGAPVAWFPPRVQEFFKRQGIEKATTRLSNEIAEKEIPGFRKITWAIDLPQVGFLTLGHALTELENEEPLLEIVNLQIEAVKENPELSHAILTVATTLRQ